MPLCVCVCACQFACMHLWLLDENRQIVCCGNIKCVWAYWCLRRADSVSEVHRIAVYQNSNPQCRWTGKAAIGLYVMQVIAWCVYSYSAPFPTCPSYVLFISQQVFHVSLVWGQQTLSRLAQGDPCHQRRWQNKKIASVFTQIRLLLPRLIILLCPFCFCGSC